MAEEKVVVEKLDPVGVVDYIMEDIIGLPGPGSVLKPLSPASIADTLGLPTPAEIGRATFEKVKERVEEKIVR